MMSNNWVTLSVVCGILFGFGVVCINTGSRNGIPLAVSIMSLGAIWLCLSALTVNLEMLKNVPLLAWTFLGIAGVLFFIGNFVQFGAMMSAPFAGYVIILVASTNVLVTAGFDVVRKLQTGTLALSMYEIAGTIFGLATIVCFALSARK